MNTGNDQRERRERERLARVARNRVDAAPVVEALHAAGFAVDWIADLHNKKMDYRDAIPILVEWLPKMSNLHVKEDIVRALSVEWAKRTAAPALLLTEFETVEDPTGSGIRWAIGNALEVLASDEIGDDMIRLATNRDYGTARRMVVLGLGKLKHPRVVDVLVELLADEDVAGQAVVALGKLRAEAARSRIEPFLHHEKAWIRKEAKKALKRIDKAR